VVVPLLYSLLNFPHSFKALTVINVRKMEITATMGIIIKLIFSNGGYLLLE